MLAQPYGGLNGRREVIGQIEDEEFGVGRRGADDRLGVPGVNLTRGAGLLGTLQNLQPRFTLSEDGVEFGRPVLCWGEVPAVI